MAGQFVTDIALFWPIALAGVVAVGGLGLLVIALYVVDVIKGLQRMFADYRAPSVVGRRYAHKGA